MDLLSPKFGSKFAIFIGIIALIGSAWSERIVDCPVNCPVNVYKPICSRGKSYANLCVLKQAICQNRVAQEVYNNIEPCPGYDKMEDETGASIEAVDKNGVLFRGLFDNSDSIQSKYPQPYREKSKNLKKRPCHRACCAFHKCHYFREVLHASRCWMKYHKCKKLSRKCCRSKGSSSRCKMHGENKSLLQPHRTRTKSEDLNYGDSFV